MLERIRKGSLVETAIESLRNAIEKGDWSVGDRLPVESELSESLQSYYDFKIRLTRR